MIKKLVYLKIFVQRTLTYTQVIQAGLIFIIALKSFDIPFVFYPPIFICTIICFIGFGYLERKAGLLKKETEILANENPQLMEILKILKEKNS